MLHPITFKKKIFTITKKQFDEYAMHLFYHQAEHCAVYRQFLHYLNISPKDVQQIRQIPFLPIELFKTQTITCGDRAIEKTFSSSGTTGQTTSQHHLLDLNLYEKSFTHAFNFFYRKIENYCLLALLPAYLEREGSSLVYMAQHLITKSKHSKSGFYLSDYERLVQAVLELEEQQQPTILLGVSFALWDLAEQYDLNLKHTIVMETGGMKGRRKELIRPALHEILCRGFGVEAIHSEYGMTELLSQAYSKGNGLFYCPPTMKVLIREVTDPMQQLGYGRAGAINIIDLANIHSCAFLATSDLGKCYEDGSFEVLGRMDNSDIRGCNLLVGDF